MSQFGRVIRLSSILITALLISACGFQLRGSIALADGVEPVYIGGISDSSQLAIELRNLLSASGVELSTEPSEANHHLVILEQKTDKRSAALGEGARVAEYMLTESVSFELRNNEGKPVSNPSKITERRIMPNDPNKVVSSSEEEKILRREMLQNLAAKIARQLQSFQFQSVTESEK